MSITIKTKKAKSISYGSSRALSSIKYIVIHYTGNNGDTALNNATYFATSNTREAGAHYFVDQSGVIYNSVPLNKTAWAVGGTYTKQTGGSTYYGKCTNSNSVSIELCDIAKKDPSDTMLEATRELVAYIRNQCSNAKTIIRHWDVNSKSCLPLDNTEVLTKDGWVSLADVIIGDEIAQYVPENDSIEFAKVLDTVDPHMDVVLGNHGVEATGDHRMYLKANCKNSKDFREIPWGEALTGHKQNIIKNGAVYEGSGLDLTDDELRFLVWVQEDGYYMKNNKGENLGLKLCETMPKRVLAIQSLLDTLDYDYTISKKEDCSVIFKVYNKDCIDWCEQFLDNKQFDYNLLKMTKDQFSIFCEELFQVGSLADGWQYTSISEKNLDVVQAISATKGVRTDKVKFGSLEYGYSALVSTNANYTVGGEEKTSERVTMVSCVTVPSGYILVRQGQKTFIVGNCPATMTGASNSLWTKVHDYLEDSSTALTVNGILNKPTVRKLQKWLGTTVDGVISSQPVKNKPLFKSYKSACIEFTSTPGSGSPCIRALQKKLGMENINGYLGSATIKKLQKWLGMSTYGGTMTKNTVKKLQKKLNKLV